MIGFPVVIQPSAKLLRSKSMTERELAVHIRNIMALVKSAPEKLHDYLVYDMGISIEEVNDDIVYEEAER